MGASAHLIDSAADIDPIWLQGRRRVGITAGASAPDVLVQQVIERLRSLGADAPFEVEGIEEHITFSLPRELRWVDAAAVDAAAVDKTAKQ